MFHWMHFRRVLNPTCLSVLGLLLFARSAAAQVPVIQMNAVRPVACRIGADVKMHVSGVRTDEVHRLHFSSDTLAAKLLSQQLPFSNEPAKQYGTFQLVVAAESEPGLYEVWAEGRHGVSNSRRIWVHPFDEAKGQPSRDVGNPTPLALGVVHQGEANPQNRHFYSVSLSAGEQLNVHCIAADVDSRMIPVLRLFDAQGNTVANQRGDDQRDPRLEFQSQSGGDYVLAVNDLLFRGGTEYGYAIVATSAEQQARLSDALRDPQKYFRGSHHLSEIGAQAIDQVKYVPEQIEAWEIEVPCELRSQFDSERDVDSYTFTGQEGESYQFEVLSERLGEPTDCRLTLFQVQSNPPRTKQLFQADDIALAGNAAIRLGSSDPRQLFKLPQAGSYVLEVHDLDNGTQMGDVQDYVLSIRRPDPQFQMFVYPPFASRDVNATQPQGLKLVANGTVSLQVFCDRLDGWEGPIELRVEGLPEGVSCSPAVLAANRSSCMLTLAAKADVSTVTFSPVVIGAAVQESGDELVATALPLSVTWGKGAGRDFIRTRSTAELVGMVTVEDHMPISLGLEESVSVKQGEVLKLPVKLQRDERAKQNCVLRPQDLPPKVKCGEITIAGDKEDGVLEFTVAKDTPVGIYTVWLQMETKVKWQDNPQRLERAKVHRAMLDQIQKKGSPEEPQLAEAIAAADQRIEAAKADAASKDINVFIPSKHFQFHVVSP